MTSRLCSKHLGVRVISGVRLWHPIWAIGLIVVLVACYQYRPQALTTLTSGQISAGTRLRLYYRDASRAPVELELTSLKLPFLSGNVAQQGASVGERVWSPVRVDLREISRLEVEELDGSASAGAALGTIGVLLGLFAIALATKESCPLLFIDRGQGLALVGEAYAGAAFRAIQRRDLLPVEDFSRPVSVRLRLGNHAHETQYTDFARLVVVDHRLDARVLSTNEARLVSVGPAYPAERIVAAGGRDVSGLLAARDGAVWESDMEDLAAQADPPRWDGVEASFALPSGGGAWVLELVASNSPLLDVTFGRFFAAMGERLEGFLAEGNDPAARERLESWRLREGVDLVVEVRRGSGWRVAGVVPTVGPIALRHVAVELPVLAVNDRLEVRVRAGTGFWRIDQLLLSRRDDAALAVTELAPTRAESKQGDERGALAEVDGRYQALAVRGESLDLDFDVPARPSGTARSAFFLSSGYYNVHRPYDHAYKPGDLLVAAREEGGLARFALDLYRQYHALLTAEVATATSGASVLEGSRRGLRVPPAGTPEGGSR